MRDLIRTGDNIGLGGSDEPILIGLKDRTGRRFMVSLPEMLAMADRIGESGYQRLAEALPFCAKEGYMTPEDMAAWHAAEHRIAELMYDRAQDLDVSFWQVAEDQIEGGQRVSGVRLSRKFATEQLCREAAAEIKATRPDAYVVRHTVHFHWGRPENIAARDELLKQIHCEEPSHV